MSTVVDVSTVAGGVAAVVVPVAAATVWLRARYKKTLGSRRDLSRRLEGLACGVTEDYMISLLGFPAFRHSRGDFIDSTFVSRHAAIQVIIRRDVGVVRWMVTSRDDKFRPTFRLPPMDLSGRRWAVRLGDVFSTLSRSPSRIQWQKGARRFNYVERYYFGNPGSYQWYIAAFNDAGMGNLVPEELQGFEADFLIDERPGELEKLQSFRQKTTANTFGVVGPLAEEDGGGDWPAGSNEDIVRILDSVEVTLPWFGRLDRALEAWRTSRRRRKAGR